MADARKRARSRRWIAGLIVCLFTVGLAGYRDREGRASAVLYWGDQPKIEELKELRSRGVKSLINVRTNPCRQTGEAARAMGLRYFHLKTGVFLPPGEKEIGRFIEILRDPANRPAYVFCFGGRDRTAFYVALHRMAFQKCSAAQASKELSAHDLRSWWPTFGRYDDVLRQNEAKIRDLAGDVGQNANDTCSLIGDQACPCRLPEERTAEDYEESSR